MTELNIMTIFTIFFYTNYMFIKRTSSYSICVNLFYVASFARKWKKSYKMQLPDCGTLQQVVNVSWFPSIQNGVIDCGDGIAVRFSKMGCK